jgi:citrate synthase
MEKNGADTGLQGVVVADTRLSDIDGEGGRLVLAGWDVERLAREQSFEGVCALLWQKDPAEVRRRIGAARARAFERLDRLGDALDRPSGMDALRAGLAHAEATDDPVTDAVSLVGEAAVFVAAWLRGRARMPPVAPEPERSHAEDFLRTALGEAPCAEGVRALEAYLVTVSDHGMNASTFAARVVASTGSDMVSAVVAAVGALKGPLHGGAPGPVLDMLDAIGRMPEGSGRNEDVGRMPEGSGRNEDVGRMPEGSGRAENARRWIERELDAGRRIMGMGHRVYRARDPRAAVFEAHVEELARAAAQRGGPEGDRASARLALARAVEREAEAALRARHPDRPLRANVEFFTAVLLEAVGLPREAFSATFAAGRMAGWCAHVLEQRERGRLIRPSSRYVGRSPDGAAAVVSRF